MIVFDHRAAYIRHWCFFMATPALELGWPGQVCFDSADNLYLVDSEDSQIVYLDPWFSDRSLMFSAWPHWRNGDRNVMGYHGISWDIM